ncbi:MAG TPA: AI-2E family transporter [Phycisphaerae bacterium]
MAQSRFSQIIPGMFRAACLIVVVVGLYVARDLCIPIALAVLLSFLLAPIVSRVQKWHIPRVPAVMLVMLFILIVIGSVGWLAIGQTIQLADRLPEYQATVHQKLEAFHTRPGSTFDRLNHTFEDFATEVDSITSQPAASQPDPLVPATAPAETAPKAIEVTLAKPHASGLEILRNIMVRTLSPIATLGIVLILTLFMLIQREDLRDRVLRLLGRGQLNMSTKAIDDATGRISRYLLMQLMVNSIFGACIWIGLFFIGVPYSPLWGLMAACFRFMPYFGVPAASIPPILMAFVSAPGFMAILLTIVLFAGLELLISYVVEPWLYGAHTGISALAILGSAFFWAWIWGPVGLLLSTPITVCLVVLGHYVPGMQFLEILFGDAPALAPEVRFYQRLLAGDQDEAAEIAEQFFHNKTLAELYDQLLIPALVLAEQDRHRGELDENRERFIYQSFADLIGEFEERTPHEHHESKNGDSKVNEHLEDEVRLANGPWVLCAPANDQADELAARMLAGLLRQRGLRVNVLSMDVLAGESVKAVGKLNPDVVVISAVPPHAGLYARYRSKRLRAAYPDLKLVVGLWKEPEDSRQIERRFPGALVDYVVRSVQGAVERITSLTHDESRRELVEVGTEG